MHISVLKEEIIDYLSPHKNGYYIDGTVGCGGHAWAILQCHSSIQLLGIDRDNEVLQYAKKFLMPFLSRISLVQGNYSEMGTYLPQGQKVDGIVLDLGVSSIQLDRASRGFSFQKDGPLDMRMNREETLTAKTLLLTSSEETLRGILEHYGEESRAAYIAKSISANKKILKKTGDLAALIEACAPRFYSYKQKNRMLSRCFQAIRIVVNKELIHLRKILQRSIDLLLPGGKIAIISFHSLEDRIVKEAFRQEALSCVCPPEIPVCCCNQEPRLQVLTKKPITPQKIEMIRNPRSRSGKLRVAKRI